MKTIIRNACIVNEGNRYVADILISNERIAKIDESIHLSSLGSITEIDAKGLSV